METSKINSWLQIGSNVGLIAGLLLVAVQIKQNTEIAEHEQYSNRYSLLSDRSIAMLGENPSAVLAKSLMSPQNLTPEEMHIVDAWLNIQLDHWLMVKNQGARGAIEKTEWLKVFDKKHPEYIPILENWMSYPIGKAWWETEGKTHGDEEFTQAITNLTERDTQDPSIWVSDFQSNIKNHIDRLKTRTAAKKED